MHPFGRLLLDPATMVGVGVHVGSGTQLMPVPSNPLLAGSEVHWQVARFDPGTGEITLTPSVVSHFER